jgi:hypothetical protein
MAPTLITETFRYTCSEGEAVKRNSHGQRCSDCGLFSCPIPQRQPHVVNRDGARRQNRGAVEEPQDRSASLALSELGCGGGRFSRGLRSCEKIRGRGKTFHAKAPSRRGAKKAIILCGPCAFASWGEIVYFFPASCATGYDLPPATGVGRYPKIAKGTKARGPAKQVALRLISGSDIL